MTIRFFFFANFLRTTAALQYGLENKTGFDIFN